MIKGMVLVLALVPGSGSEDLLSVQRAVVADLIGEAGTKRTTVFCVWASPPAGDPEGTKAPNAGINLRVPLASFLSTVRVKNGVSLRRGSECEARLEGARVRESNEPAWIVDVDAPKVDGAAAVVEGGSYCGGECAAWYRFSLELTTTGWRIKSKELLSIS